MTAKQAGGKADMEFHEYAELFPMMNGDALADLRNDVEAHGVREPVVFLDGKILDGRNRYKCAVDLGVEFPRVEYDGPDPLAFVISHNLHRRHLSESQRAMVAARLAKLERGHNQHTSIDGTSQEQAAKMLNVGVKSVERAKKVQNNGSPELVKAVENGTASVSAAAMVSELPKEEQDEIVAYGKQEIVEAYKAIQAEKREAKRAEVAAKLDDTAAREVKEAQGVYDVIVLDPPWPMKKIDRDERPNQVAFDYPTMTEEELSELHVPAADDCHVWVWTTQKYLPMSLRLLDIWGLKYVCTFVWHKPGGFQPIGLPQYNAEFAVYARKGAPQFIDTKAFPTCFDAPRGKHSEKPEEFYEVLRRVTGGRRLDMFNRRKIDGFDGWGNESE